MFENYDKKKEKFLHIITCILYFILKKLIFFAIKLTKSKTIIYYW